MHRSFVPLAGLVCAGVLIWAMAFLAAYGYAAVACARGYSETTLLGTNLVVAVIAGSSLAALCSIGASARRTSLASDARTDRTLAGVARIVCLLGAIAVVWNALPAFIVGTRC